MSAHESNERIEMKSSVKSIESQYLLFFEKHPNAHWHIFAFDKFFEHGTNFTPVSESSNLASHVYIKINDKTIHWPSKGRLLTSSIPHGEILCICIQLLRLQHQAKCSKQCFVRTDAILAFSLSPVFCVFCYCFPFFRVVNYCAFVAVPRVCVCSWKFKTKNVYPIPSILLRFRRSIHISLVMNVLLRSSSYGFIRLARLRHRIILPILQ